MPADTDFSQPISARDYEAEYGEPMRCTCCERTLRQGTWLEMDQRTGNYHRARAVPEEHSQGWFVFGSSCAKRLHKAATAGRS